VGPDEQGTRAGLQKQAARLGIAEDVTFSEPVFGAEKFAFLASADLFVLPTRNENFGIVVAEALACGVPVITTKGAPWQELLGSPASSKVLECGSSKVREPERVAVGSGSRQSVVRPGTAMGAKAGDFRTLELSNFRTDQGRCGWWVEIGVEPLAEALREAMSLTDEKRQLMGENGRRLVEKKYQWERVAEQMTEVYRTLLASGK